MRSKLVDFFGDHQNGGLICIVQRHSVSQKSQQPIPDPLGRAFRLSDRIMHTDMFLPTQHWEEMSRAQPAAIRRLLCADPLILPIRYSEYPLQTCAKMSAISALV